MVSPAGLPRGLQSFGFNPGAITSRCLDSLFQILKKLPFQPVSSPQADLASARRGALPQWDLQETREQGPGSLDGPCSRDHVCQFTFLYLLALQCETTLLTFALCFQEEGLHVCHR